MFHVKHKSGNIILKSSTHLKSTWRQLRATRGELQQPGHFGLRKVADGRPEPHDDPTELGRIAVNDVVGFEVGNRVFSGAAQQQLQSR